MQIPQIIQLLQNTLNPSLTHQATQSLLNERQRVGFITNLLIISDNSEYSTAIRQSSLIQIKNAIIDDFNKAIQLPDSDFQTIKSSILQALIRNCQQKSISPTIRQIIFVLAEQQFPQNWHDIIPQIANYIQNSGDFNELLGSIEALKAIVSSIVKKVDIKLTLDNICNKIVIPLLALASKLFQSYNDTTSFILISIFKIFSTITNFHIPQIVVLNMHSWMLFIKKILDLNIQGGNIDMNMYHLKKICLRILFRFYQRHLNRKFSTSSQCIINDFHNQFTKGITQSLLLQIINQSQLTKKNSGNNNKNYIKLTKYALACLSYVYEQDQKARIVIENYKEKIIYLCLERYKVRVDKMYVSYGEFMAKISQQRTHLCQFITSLIKNNYYTTSNINNFNQQSNNTAAISILGCLYNYIDKSDNQMKQLCLYIYSRIASVLPEGDSDIQSKMLTFILNIVKPLLHHPSTPQIVKLRCCQLLSHYSYIPLPQNQLTQICSGVYSCLISTLSHPNPTSIQTFVQIQSVYAFNSLLRFDFVVNFTAPYLSNILQVYTALLEIEVGIIKCLEDMLAKFQPHLQPYGNGLIEMLTTMFFKYHQLVVMVSSSSSSSNHNNININNSKCIKNQQQQQYDYSDQDDDNDIQFSQNNYLNASKACLSAIRQIIQVPEFNFSTDHHIHNILILIFTDKQMLYVQQGFNILNQILFKKKSPATQYQIYFCLIVYGILPLSENYINILKNENSTYTNTLLNMLQCQCADPDPDFLQNTIGCLRNFIAKYNISLRNHFDKSGISFLHLLLDTVKFVHQNQSTKANQSERSIILTIYMSLIQWKVLNNDQVKDMLQLVAMWMDMEKEVVKAENHVIQEQNINRDIKQQLKKTIYCPIYMQVILLAIHFYPTVTISLFNGNWLALQLLHNWSRFHIDYQISRLLIGLSDLLTSQVLINEQQLVREIMNRIPKIIEILCNMRMGQIGNCVNSQDDQAEEERYFGLDENTHIMGWRRVNEQQRLGLEQLQQNNSMDDEDNQSDDQQDQEFNKYYQSPLDSIDQVAYILNTLRSPQSQPYMNLMTNDSQQKLSYLVQNTPPKFNQQNNN